MLVAAELTLHGVPAMKMPDNWPHYDIVAQPSGGGPAQRISVKARTFKHGSDTFVTYQATDQFDWLAIVLLPGADQMERRFFIVPRAVADARATKAGATAKVANDRYWTQDQVVKMLGDFKDNFCLSLTGTTVTAP